MRKSRITTLLGVALALSGTAFGQGGDSSLRGSVTDESGAVLPGVTVTATSPALISPAVSVSDSSGDYRLLNLPPGDYVVEASLSGFATFRQDGIVLRASVNLGVDVVMTISSVQETVTVTAETPMLEISRPSNILNVEGEFQRDMPLQARSNWSDFLELTPGVNARPFDDASGRMVYFGHATEHFAHVIQLEGMAANGYNDAQITYVAMGADMIEDVSIKTGGAEAKDPMGTGIVINVVTKSGGNDLSASGGYMLQDYTGWGNEDGGCPPGSSDDCRTEGFWGFNNPPTDFNPFASEKANFAALGVYTPPDEVVGSEGTPTQQSVNQADFSLGGPIATDRAWFFASYRYADLASQISRTGANVSHLTNYSGIPLGNYGTVPVYEKFPNTSKSHQPYGKITARMNENHEISAYYQSDILDNTSNREYNWADNGPVTTGGNLFGAKLTSIFGASTTGQFTFSYNNKTLNVHQDKAATFVAPLYIEIHRTFSVNASGTTSSSGRQVAGGRASFSKRPSTLMMFRGDLTHFVEDLAGSHEFQVGVYMVPISKYAWNTEYSNGTSWSTENHALLDPDNPAAGTAWFYRQRYSPGVVARFDHEDRDFAGYIQDSWKPIDRLTLNLGLRADFVRRYDNVIDHEKMNTVAIGPRFGFSYMLTDDARTVLRGNIGRVHEQMNGRDAVTFAANSPTSERWREYDHDADGVPDHEVYTPPTASLDPSVLIDPNLSQPFVDEAIFGIRRQFPGQIAIDAAFVHRRYTDVYALVDQNGTYPAEGTVAPFGGFGRVDADAGIRYQQTNTDWSRLVYSAIEITSTKRTERMQVMLNFNRQWQGYSGTWNPTDPARWIQPDKFASDAALYMPRGNRDENTLRSSNDLSYAPTWRQYSFRSGFTYLLPWDITIAGSFTMNAGPWSGPPISRLDSDDPTLAQWGPAQTENGQTNPLSTRYRIVGQDRGELQVQAPTVRTLGLNIGKSFRFGDVGSIEVTAKIFNILNAHDHNQFTYSAANRTFSSNFLELRSLQAARAFQLATVIRF